MKKRRGHVIKSVEPGSIGEEMGLEPGDKIVAVDGTEIEDIFDYQFLIQDTYIEVLVETKDGEECLLEIDKDFDEDLGVEFDNGLMDEYRHCHNKCIFCGRKRRSPSSLPLSCATRSCPVRSPDTVILSPKKSLRIS